MGLTESYEVAPSEDEASKDVAASNGGDQVDGTAAQFLPLPAAQQEWAHAVSSQAMLREALEDDKITAIEADVLMGSAPGSKDQAPIPIMAHPPDRVSDLPFQDFLEACIENGRCHIKLDFKEIDAVQACLPLVATSAPRLLKNGQAVMLNADVLPGPGRRDRCSPVPADAFFNSVLAHCPGAPLSLGWSVFPAASGRGYREADCSAMIAAYEVYLSRIGVPAGGVVFAAALRLAAKSFEPLAKLLSEFPQGQLLLWTGRGEPPVPSWTVRKLTAAFDEAGLSDRVGFDCQVASSSAEALKAEIRIRFGGALNCMGWM